jgi:hypothetical protein
MFHPFNDTSTQELNTTVLWHPADHQEYGLYFSQLPTFFLTHRHLQIRKQEFVLHPKANTEQETLLHPL